MNEKTIDDLFEQLKLSGATKEESEELSLFSKNLSNLYNFQRSEKFKDKFLDEIFAHEIISNRFSRLFSVALLSILLLVGYVSTVSAQGSYPGDPLYPVKIVSEQVASVVNPSFRNEILTRRSEEIKNLSNKNSSYSFYQTIDNYQKELSKNSNIDKKNLQESKKNLQEAQKTSLPGYKSQIQNAIVQTEHRQDELDKDVKGESTSSSPRQSSQGKKSGGKNSSHNR